jgi:toxin ParE1/3/4
VARIEMAPEFGDDMDRITDHLLLNEVTGIEPRLRGIVAAIEVLRANPLIGRPMGEEMRELIIGRGTRGYVALYQYVATVDTVFVLAIRAQREDGYA